MPLPPSAGESTPPTPHRRLGNSSVTSSGEEMRSASPPGSAEAPPSPWDASPPQWRGGSCSQAVRRLFQESDAADTPSPLLASTVANLRRQLQEAQWEAQEARLQAARARTAQQEAVTRFRNASAVPARP